MLRLVALGVLIGILGVILWGITSGDESTRAAPAEQRPPTTTMPVEPPPVLAGAVEPLTDLDGWLQTDVTSLADLRGQVVIVHFWTFSCINCKRTLPHLRAIYADHRADGLEIVGVHSPEFVFEEDPAAVAAAAEELGVTWPIALDTRQRNFFAWQGSRGYWPRTYVLDRSGRVRFDHIGEGAYDELAATVAQLLKESA